MANPDGQPAAASEPDEGIIDPVEVRIERSDVVTFLDYPTGRQPPDRILTLLDEAVTEARALVHARGAYRRIDPTESHAIGLDAVAADGLVIGLVTAGPDLENRASALLAAGELTRAVLLDAAGSAAAEEAADRMGEIIGGAYHAAEPGAAGRRSEADLDGRGPAQALLRSSTPPALVDGSHEQPGDEAAAATAFGERAAARISCRLSPGYGRWTLRWQRELFARLPHRELGVELSDLCLMMPRKSISFAMWLGARERIAQGLGGCDRCTLSRCRYRRISRPEGPAPS